MKKDLRKMLKDGMTIVDYADNSYIITNNGLNYIDECDADVVLNVYDDFDEGLKDIIFGDKYLDIELVYDDEDFLIWERNKDE